MPHRNKDIEFIANAIIETKRAIEHEFFKYSSSMHVDGKYEEEHNGYTKCWLKESIKDLYNLILSFYEAKELTCSYENFKSEFEKTIKNEDELLSEKLYDPEGYHELIILYEFKRYLLPHKELSIVNTFNKSFEKVVSILENTGHIINRIGKTIVGEADIYNPVKWILSLYYYDVRTTKNASFIQQFKTYKPDILIPELNTAIEYKYIKTKKENFIDDYIDQIKIDSVNYSGDSRYSNFIAVIHLEYNTISTPEQIRNSWKSKKIPNNWKLIITNS